MGFIEESYAASWRGQSEEGRWETELYSSVQQCCWSCQWLRQGPQKPQICQYFPKLQQR